MHYQQRAQEMTLQRTGLHGEIVVDYELVKGYNELGVAQGRNESYDAAETSFLKAIEICNTLADVEEHDLSWPAPNLGLILWVTGRLVEAEVVLRNILDIRRRAFGVDDVVDFL